MLVTRQKRGIKVKESRAESPEDYTNLISVTTHSAKGSHQLAGSLFAPREVRIVQVEGYHVDVIPQGHFRDKPPPACVIGEVTSTSGDQYRHYAGGPRGAGGDAVMILSIDSVLTEDILAEIAELKILKRPTVNI